MRRTVVVVALLLLSCPVLTFGGQLQKELRSRWLGAWIVVSTESYSDCTGSYTNNRINDNLVKSGGRLRFQAGEIAKLNGVDLKRSRLDLHLTFGEPTLLPYQDGPFTLYREALCKVEFQVELPRHVVKNKDAEAVEEFLRRVVERYATEGEARDSDAYNGRVMEPYPEDYEITLARHAVWKAEQTNAAVQAAIDHAVEETTRLTDRLESNPIYLAGFAEGVEDARGVNLEGCPTLLSVDLGDIRRQAARAKAKEEGIEAEAVRGYEDGKALVYGLEMLRNLPYCFVPVPDLDEATARAAAQR